MLSFSLVTSMHCLSVRAASIHRHDPANGRREQTIAFALLFHDDAMVQFATLSLIHETASLFLTVPEDRAASLSCNANGVPWDM